MSLWGEIMPFDENYEEDFFVDNIEEVPLMEVSEEGFFSNGVQNELDYELYEEEKADAEAYDEDFPESYEEWVLLKNNENWDHELDGFNNYMDMEYEE